MKNQITQASEVPEDIKKAFGFYMVAANNTLKHDYEPGYRKAEALAQRRYNKFSKLCDFHGLQALTVATILNNS